MSQGDTAHGSVVANVEQEVGRKLLTQGEKETGFAESSPASLWKGQLSLEGSTQRHLHPALTQPC